MVQCYSQLQSKTYNMKTATALCFAVTLLAFAQGEQKQKTELPTTENVDSSPSSISESDGTTRSPEQGRQQLKDQMAALTESCKSVAKVTLEQSKIATNQGVPKSEPERCFLGCIYDGIGITKDGQFNEQGARTLAQLRFGSSPDELTKANHMIESCAKEIIVKDANEKCALGRLVRECIVKHGDKINFFPKP